MASSCCVLICNAFHSAVPACRPCPIFSAVVPLEPPLLPPMPSDVCIWLSTSPPLPPQPANNVSATPIQHIRNRDDMSQPLPDPKPALFFPAFPALPIGRSDLAARHEIFALRGLNAVAQRDGRFQAILPQRFIVRRAVSYCVRLEAPRRGSAAAHRRLLAAGGQNQRFAVAAHLIGGDGVFIDVPLLGVSFFCWQRHLQPFALVHQNTELGPFRRRSDDGPDSPPPLADLHVVRLDP